MINKILKEEYNERQHSSWRKFGNYYYKTKTDLVKDLAAGRKYPDAPTQETHPHLFAKNPQGVSSYKGNPNIKNAYVTDLEYTPEQLNEYKRCMKDPTYFAETYVRIMSVDFGVIPFTLYSFQRGMIDDFKNNRFNICKLPRQCGKSTTSVAFILWYILFNPGKTVGMLANKGELAQEILGRLQLAYETLPFWIQQGCTTFNKRSMELENGSKIIATSSSGSAARGMSFSLIFLDEFAFVPANDAEDFFRSVYPTISSGADTKMIVVSTPKGMNHFYKMWMEAITKRSAFNPIEINWFDVPGRDEEWKEAQIANTSPDQFRQEFETEFIGSASTLISPTKLATMTYINPRRSQDNVDIYEEPRNGHKYLIAADCARGIRLDYSAFVVIDVSVSPYKLVAKFRDNTITPMIYPQFLVNIGRFYNDAFLLIETNDVGGQVAEAVAYNFEYENILKTVSKGRGGFQLGEGKDAKIGVTTSSSVKKKGCSNFKSLIEANKLLIEDYDVFVEMTTFTRKSDSASSTFAAEPGTNDDLVMCLVLFSWCVGTTHWKEITGTAPEKQIYEEKALEEDKDVMPLGYVSVTGMKEAMIDSRGDFWSTVEQDDPLLPDWYEDVYTVTDLYR